MLVFAGNPTQYHAPLFRAMTKAGLDIEVLFGDEIGAKPFYNPELSATIEWDVPVLEGYRYRFFRNLAREGAKGFFSRNNPAMFAYVVRSDARTVLIHGYDTLTSWYVFLAALLSRKQVIWRGETIKPKTQGRRVVQLLKKMVLPVYFRLCDVVLFSCTRNREYLEEFVTNTEKLVSFPCSVDNEFFQARYKLHQPDRAEIRRHLDLGADSVVIASCCRLTTRKRVDAIIRAVARLSEKDVAILVIGDGPERESLKDLAEEMGVDFRVSGFVGQYEVAKLLSVSDIFCLMSEYDASPKALNEALNFNLPLVISDGVGTAPDLVKDDVNGFVITDTGELTPKLEKLASDRSLRKAFGEKNHQILEEYCFDVAVKNLQGTLDA